VKIVLNPDLARKARDDFGAFSAAYEWAEPVIEHLQTVGALVWTGITGSRRDLAPAPVETGARVAQMPDRLGNAASVSSRSQKMAQPRALFSP